LSDPAQHEIIPEKVAGFTTLFIVIIVVIINATGDDFVTGNV